MNLNSTSIIQQQVDADMTSKIRTKIRLRQISEIYCELIELRDGESKYTCKIRNLLQIFGGEMKLHCLIDLDKEISSFVKLLDEGISISNWEKVNNVILQLYEQVLRICSIIYR
ncbi:MAG: hypothetical protein ACXAAM_06655 [Candidatus Heimdallarchaeaceae archaeon]|jgi:hypothetical protein